MKKNSFSLILISIILSLFTSCITNYYSMYTTEEAAVFSNSKEAIATKFIIPRGTLIYVTKGNTKRSKVKWNNYSGWINKSSYSYYKPDNSAVLNSPINNEIVPSKKTNDYRPSSTSGGTVQVKGYYRKNGTYVRPHTRSSPRRR